MRRCRSCFVGATALIIVVVTTLASCAKVQPWERGHLAHDCMQIPVDAAESAHFGHVQAVREGSSGGATEGGGGCGCN